MQEDVGWEELLALLYADEIILTARNKAGMHNFLLAVIRWSRKWRMVINTDKTVILALGSRSLPSGDKDHKVTTHNIGGATYTQVDQSLYRGKMFNQRLSWDSESGTRVGKAYAALDQLSNVQQLLGSLKALRVYRQWFVPAIAYGAEAVVYNATSQKKLGILDRAAWRICLGVEKRRETLCRNRYRFAKRLLNRYWYRQYER